MQFRDLTHLSSFCVEYWCCKLQARNFFLYCKKKSKELGSEALSRTGRPKVSYPESISIWAMALLYSGPWAASLFLQGSSSSWLGTWQALCLLYLPLPFLLLLSPPARPPRNTAEPWTPPPPQPPPRTPATRSRSRRGWMPSPTTCRPETRN